MWNLRTFLVGAWKTVAVRAMQTMEAHHKRFQNSNSSGLARHNCSCDLEANKKQKSKQTNKKKQKGFFLPMS